MMVFLLEPGVPPLLHSLPSLRFSLFIENLKTSKLPLERSDIVASSTFTAVITVATDIVGNTVTSCGVA